MTDDHVLTKSTLRAGSQLGLTDAEIANLLEIDLHEISAVNAGLHYLCGDTRAGQRAIALVKVCKALMANVGLDESIGKLWISSHNTALAGVPASLMQTDEGMNAVLAYLQQMGTTER